MPARRSRLAAFGLLALLASWANAADVPAFPEPSATDRVLIVSPHPDDESLCCAGLIQRAVANGAAVAIVWVTAGDAFEFDALVVEHHLRLKGLGMQMLGRTRIDEALAAGARLGVPRERLMVLGYPDQGVAALLGASFDLPWWSRWTRADRVPYLRALAPGTEYRGRNLERDLARVIDDFAPTQVFAAAPEDRHPDHAASGAFALRVLAARGQADRLHYWLVHAGSAWPRPHGLHPELPLGPPPTARQRTWLPFELTAAERDGKLDALTRHRTQWRVMAPYLRAFVRRNELFTESPRDRREP